MHTIVDRSKKVGIKSVLKTGQPGPRLQHLLDAIVDEFAENEDLPDTGAPPGSSPDDQLRTTPTDRPGPIGPVVAQIAAR